MKKLEEKLYKVIFIGECSVGKSSICRSLTHRQYDERYESTIGAAFNMLSIEQPEVKQKHVFHIWDTAGQERFQSLLPLYFRDAPICIIVFDVSDRDSFEKVFVWARLYKKHSNLAEHIIYLIGNKIDLRDRDGLGNKCVSRAEGEERAEQIDAFYDETSALNNQTMHVFDNISTLLAGTPKYQIIKTEQVKVVSSEPPKKDDCSC